MFKLFKFLIFNLFNDSSWQPRNCPSLHPRVNKKNNSPTRTHSQTRLTQPTGPTDQPNGTSQSTQLTDLSNQSK